MADTAGLLPQHGGPSWDSQSHEPQAETVASASGPALHGSAGTHGAHEDMQDRVSEPESEQQSVASVQQSESTQSGPGVLEAAERDTPRGRFKLTERKMQAAFCILILGPIFNLVLQRCAADRLDRANLETTHCMMSALIFLTRTF